MMRSTSMLLAGIALLLAACGDADGPAGIGAPSPTDPPVASAPTDEIARRAIDTPGSVAELDGVLVRYYEPPGEGPGFDLRFLDDGTAVYVFLANDPQPFDTVSGAFDSDELTMLIDDLEPSDVAAGADDCMPEVDGSAPLLSIATFEVDYCYTNPVEHPLIELVRSTRAGLHAELEELNADPPDDNASPDGFPTPTDFEGVLVRYSMPGGECDRCDFETTFRADGTLQLRSTRGDHDGTFDAATLRDLVDAFDPAGFVTSETDCGREVDGNAPIFAVPDAEIDLCFWEVDGTDPLYAFVVLDHRRIEAERDATSAGDAVVARVTWTGGLCPDGICSTTLELRADGTWSSDDGDTTTQGTYDAGPLVAAIRADYVSSPVLGPFTDECPTAYDGAEVIYELTDPTTGEIVFEGRTCRDEIDPEHPLIVAVQNAVDETLR